MVEKEEMAIARKQLVNMFLHHQICGSLLGNHTVNKSIATNKHATIEGLLSQCWATWCFLYGPSQVYVTRTETQFFIQAVHLCGGGVEYIHCRRR
jgi:hypothetical protein